jgi:hypothetical protein
LERIKEFAMSARASVVPEIAEISSLDMNESGREDGDKVELFGAGTKLGPLPDAPTDADRAICTFEGFFGILIGAGAGFFGRR